MIVSIVIFNTILFSFNARDKNDLHTIRVLEYSEFEYTFTFKSEFYTFINNQMGL